MADKPERYDTVILRRDIRTRGGVRFRQGVKMIVRGVHGGYFLSVKVRGSNHHLSLKKKDWPYYFEVHSKAPEEYVEKKNAESCLNFQYYYDSHLETISNTTTVIFKG